MFFNNCRNCGRAYRGSNPDLCPDCLEQDEDNFLSVRNFIKANPKVSLEVVAEATGVEEEKIRTYLRDGRLEAASLTGPVLECHRCGKPIQNGMYCVLCSSKIKNTFAPDPSLAEEPPKNKRKNRSFARNYRDKD